jgi:hypothetical protein
MRDGFSLSPRSSSRRVFPAANPRHFAFYSWLAERHLTPREQSGVHYTEVRLNELLRVHQSQPDLSEHAVNTLHFHLKQGQISEDLIQQRKSRVNEALPRALGQDDMPYHIAGTGRIPGTQYQRQGLSLQPSAIVFAPLSLPEAADE